MIWCPPPLLSSALVFPFFYRCCRAFTEGDLEQWILKTVHGMPEKELNKASKALQKKGLVEKVALSSFFQLPSK